MHYRIAAGRFLGALALLLTGAAAHAQWVVGPIFGSVTAEENTNLFAVPKSNEVNDPHGDPRLGDFVTTYQAGIDAAYVLGQQRIYGALHGSELTYAHFTDLNHTEYFADLGVDYKIAQIIDGIVDAQQQRNIVQFADRTTSQLTIETNKTMKGSFNTNVTPEWRIESYLTAHVLDSPLVGAPDFSLHEVTSDLGLKYVGIAHLNFGLEFLHVNGHFSGAPGAIDYSQNALQFAWNYKLSGVTTFNGALGYTNRHPKPTGGVDEAGGSISGFTGALGYNRQITGKTAFNIQVNRAINSYYNAGGSEIDTGVQAGVIWQTTPKLAVTLNAGYMHSAFAPQGVLNEQGQVAGRVDKLSNEALQLTYTPRLWLILRPYVKHVSRDSTIELFTYRGFEYGVEFRVLRPAPGQ